MERGQVPLVSARLVLAAGEISVPRERAGLAVLTGDSLQGGTARRSGVQLAEALESLGSALRVSVGWEAMSVEFTCLAERLDEMLSLLAEVVREPSFPDEEVERIRRQRLATIHQRRMEPDERADDELDRAIFAPDHPFHRSLAGTAEAVGSLGAADARTYAAASYGAAGGGFVLVGDIPRERVVELGERHFGEWLPNRSGAYPSFEAPASERRVVIVNRPGSVQSELRIGLPGPSRGHPDEVPLRVANLALGGSFTSRLNLSLRERHGFTYGARSGFAFRKRGGLFSISTAVQTDVTVAALGETMEVFRRFVEEGPSPVEMERSRDYLAGVFPLRMESTSQLADRLAELVIYGLPHDYHHRYRDEIRGVQIEGARAAVLAHLDPATCAVVLVGDADRIASGVSELGLGPLEVLDA